jgi:hypothetical protein
VRPTRRALPLGREVVPEVVRALAEEQAARRRRLQLGIRLAARVRVAQLARGSGRGVGLSW